MSAPEQVLRAEEAVLGSLFLDPTVLPLVAAVLAPEDFAQASYRAIYAAICGVARAGHAVDVVSVGDELDRLGLLDGLGGIAALAGFLAVVPSAIHAERYAGEVKRAALRRALAEIGAKVSALADDGRDVADLITDAQAYLLRLTERATPQAGIALRDALGDYWQELQDLLASQGQLRGVQTGFVDINTMTGGWQKDDLIVIAARPGVGKCLGKGTKVVMFDGTLRAVEEVREGDLLMGPDSLPRRVAGVTTGREEMYLIHQNRGIDYRVNASHILSLRRSKTEGPHRQGDILNISVRDYLTKGASFASRYKGYKVAVEYPERDLTVEPYFLGVWLGDGTAENIGVSNPDPEIIAYLREYADRLGMICRESPDATKCPVWSITKGHRGGGRTLQGDLRALGILGNKHIPHAYLASSAAQRRLLLAGLLDTDGHYHANANCYEITQASERMARDIKLLADSLGLRTSLHQKTTTWTHKGVRKHSTAWRVGLSGDLDTLPLRVARKQARPWTHKAHWRSTGITVTPEGEGDYYGFTLDGDGLFLLEDMTVTHNTSFALMLALNAALAGTSVAFFSVEMPAEQLAQRAVAVESGVDAQRLRLGTVDDRDLRAIQEAMGRLAPLPVTIYDTPALSLTEMRAHALRQRAAGGVGIIFVDYLQLMRGATNGRESNRQVEVAAISRGLKGLARELGVPVVALAQLNRAVEGRASHRPQLSDLRESGAIEQDADMVMFVHREEMYDEGAERGVTDLIVAKHRNGPLGTVRLRFVHQTTRFMDFVALEGEAAPF